MYTKHNSLIFNCSTFTSSVHENEGASGRWVGVVDRARWCVSRRTTHESRRHSSGVIKLDWLNRGTGWPHYCRPSQTANPSGRANDQKIQTFRHATNASYCGWTLSTDSWEQKTNTHHTSHKLRLQTHQLNKLVTLFLLITRNEIPVEMWWNWRWTINVINPQTFKLTPRGRESKSKAWTIISCVSCGLFLNVFHNFKTLDIDKILRKWWGFVWIIRESNHR
jgi:hypothetical protein